MQTHDDPEGSDNNVVTPTLTHASRVKKNFKETFNERGQRDEKGQLMTN